MNPETGQIYEGLEAIEKGKAAAEKLGEMLVRIPERDMPRVRAMSIEDRKAYAKRLMKRRKQNKAKRKANRKRRGRR